ncbi:hypothetical protein QYM36_011119 [Artemia franciscana]|uniref:PWWP domain-containing protein n=2 Tax=Artemia franciscana TaxID=6661 RepID=A0AA88HUI7_ARTSF|nr:hypothetical protein QYM36_011119 [Artemia franciscana]
MIQTKLKQIVLKGNDLSKVNVSPIESSIMKKKRFFSQRKNSVESISEKGDLECHSRDEATDMSVYNFSDNESLELSDSAIGNASVNGLPPYNGPPSRQSLSVSPKENVSPEPTTGLISAVALYPKSPLRTYSRKSVIKPSLTPCASIPQTKNCVIATDVKDTTAVIADILEVDNGIEKNEMSMSVLLKEQNLVVDKGVENIKAFIVSNEVEDDKNYHSSNIKGEITHPETCLNMYSGPDGVVSGSHRQVPENSSVDKNDSPNLRLDKKNECAEDVDSSNVIKKGPTLKKKTYGEISFKVSKSSNRNKGSWCVKKAKVRHMGPKKQSQEKLPNLEEQSNDRSTMSENYGGKMQNDSEETLNDEQTSFEAGTTVIVDRSLSQNDQTADNVLMSHNTNQLNDLLCSVNAEHCENHVSIISAQSKEMEIRLEDRCNSIDPVLHIEAIILQEDLEEDSCDSDDEIPLAQLAQHVRLESQSNDKVFKSVPKTIVRIGKNKINNYVSLEDKLSPIEGTRKRKLGLKESVKTKTKPLRNGGVNALSKKKKEKNDCLKTNGKRKKKNVEKLKKLKKIIAQSIRITQNGHGRLQENRTKSDNVIHAINQVVVKNKRRGKQRESNKLEGQKDVSTDTDLQSSLFTSMREQGLVVRCYGPSKKLKHGNGDSTISPVKAFERKLIRQTLDISYGEIVMNEDRLNHTSGQEFNAVKENCVQSEREPPYNTSNVQEAVSKDISLRSSRIPDSGNKLMENISSCKNSDDNEVFNSSSTDAPELVNFGAIKGNESYGRFPASRIHNGRNVDYPVTEGNNEVQLVKNGCAFENKDSKFYTEENNDSFNPDFTVDRSSSVSTSISSASLFARKNKLTPFSRHAYVKRRRRKRAKRAPANSVPRISFLNKRTPLTKIPSPLKTSGSFSVKKRVGRPKKLQLTTNNENSLDCEVAMVKGIDSQIELSLSRKRRSRKMTSLTQVKSLSNPEKLESNTLYDEGDSSLSSADSRLKASEVTEAIPSNDFSDAFKERLEEREVKTNVTDDSHLGVNDEQHTIINAAKKGPGRKPYKTHNKDSGLQLASNTNQSRKYKAQSKKKESITRRSTRFSKESINGNCTPNPRLIVVNHGNSCLENQLNQGTCLSVETEKISNEEEVLTDTEDPLRSLNLHSIATLEANDLSSTENSGKKTDPSRTPEGMPAPEEQTKIKDFESVSVEKRFCSTLVDELITFAINRIFCLQEISIPMNPNNYKNDDHASGEVSHVEEIKYPNESSVGTAEKFMQEEEIIKKQGKDIASGEMICSNKTLQPCVVQESNEGKMFHTDKAMADGVSADPDGANVSSMQYLSDGRNSLENRTIPIETEDGSAFVSSCLQVNLFKSEKNEIVGAPKTIEERRPNSNDEDSLKIRTTVKVISETFLINDVNHISSSDSSDLEVVGSYSKGEKRESKQEECHVYGMEISCSKSDSYTPDNGSIHLICEGSKSIANSEHPKCCTISNTFKGRISQCNIYKDVKDLHMQFEDKTNRVKGDSSSNFTISENVGPEDTVTEKPPLSVEDNLKESDSRPTGVENKKSQSLQIIEASYNQEYHSMSTTVATKTLERKGLKESAEHLYIESQGNPKTSSKKPKINEGLIKSQTMFTESRGNQLNEGTKSKCNEMKKSVVEESSPDLQIIAELKHCKTQTDFMHATLNPPLVSNKASRPSSTYQIRMKSLDELIDDDVVVIGETRRQTDIVQKEHRPQLQESPLKKIEELTERQKFLNNNDKYSLTSILNQSLTKGLRQKGRKIRVKATNSDHYPSSSQIEKEHSSTRKRTSKTNSIIQSPTNNSVAQMSSWNPRQNMTNILIPPLLPVINRSQVQALTTPPSIGEPSQITLSPPTSVSQIICSSLPISQPVVFIPMNVMGFDSNLPEVSKLPSPPPLAHAPALRNTKKNVTTIRTDQSLNRPPLEIPSPDVSIIPVTFDNSAEETTLPSVAMSASKVTTIVKKDPSYGSCNEYNCTCKGCLAICSSPMSSLPSVICDSPATVSSENDKIIKGSINPMTLNVKKKDCVPGEIIWTCLSGSPFWPSVVSSDGKNGCIKYTAKGSRILCSVYFFICPCNVYAKFAAFTENLREITLKEK